MPDRPLQHTGMGPLTSGGDGRPPVRPRAIRPHSIPLPNSNCSLRSTFPNPKTCKAGGITASAFVLALFSPQW